MGKIRLKLIPTLSLITITFAMVSTPIYATSGGITGTDLTQIGDLLVRVANFFFGIAGAVVIILIIIGGIRYTLSSGDPKAVDSARNSITFAILGLIIILLAVAVVNFVGSILGVSNLSSFLIPGQGKPVSP